MRVVGAVGPAPGSAKTVCPDHIGDATLRAHVENHATESWCSYCSTPSGRTAATFDSFLRAFRIGVDVHYRPHRDAAGGVPRGAVV